MEAVAPLRPARRMAPRGTIAGAEATGYNRFVCRVQSRPPAVPVRLMPLQDHFRPPLSLRRHWHAFHNSWATYLSSDLNRRLPEGYFAEANVQFGIEIDVAAFDEGHRAGAPAASWSPPAAPASVP